MTAKATERPRWESVKGTGTLFCPPCTALGPTCHSGTIHSSPFIVTVQGGGWAGGHLCWVRGQLEGSGADHLCGDNFSRLVFWGAEAKSRVTSDTWATRRPCQEQNSCRPCWSRAG